MVPRSEEGLNGILRDLGTTFLGTTSFGTRSEEGLNGILRDLGTTFSGTTFFGT